MDLEEAVIAQLNAEMVAHGYNATSLSEKAQIPYQTFYRYMSGTRPMPMKVLWATLEALGMDEVTFLARARERFGQK